MKYGAFLPHIGSPANGAVRTNIHTRCTIDLTEEGNHADD